ncbi:MAG: TolC family protein, partial [Pseudohongiellaceae bacterium]
INALQKLPEDPVTLSEAMAYGVIYNLDNRVRVAEEALGQRQLDFSRWSFYPQLALSGGYTGRDNTPGSFSQSLRTGRESLEVSTSQDRERTVGDLQLVWNLLDFGVSYFNARQQANQVLILRERQSRVLQELMHEIRDAYWRVVSYQKLVRSLEPLSERLEMAIAQAETVEQEGLQTIEPLIYRQNLYTKMAQIETLREGLVAARANLNQLMNLPPTYATEVVELESNINFEPLQLSVLEDIALRSRPEIREANYQKRITADEIKKSTVRLFPGLEMSLGYNQDSNSFLNNKDWGTAGVQITWNLLNLLNGREQLALDQARSDLQQLRNIALNMSILAQVNIAYVNYEQSSRQLELNSK